MIIITVTFFLNSYTSKHEREKVTYAVHFRLVFQSHNN